LAVPSSLLYLMSPHTTSNSTTAFANNIFFNRVVVPHAMTMTSIGINIVTAAVGQGRLGIYTDRPNGSGPGLLVLDAGLIDTGTTGDKEIAISQLLQPGLYWLGINVNGGPVLRAGTSTAPLFGVSTNSISANVRFRRIWTFGPLPADQTAVALIAENNNPPQIFLRGTP
jgi:hypothetical protein